MEMHLHKKSKYQTFNVCTFSYMHNRKQKYTHESSHTEAALTHNSPRHKDKRKSEASGQAQDLEYHLTFR